MPPAEIRRTDSCSEERPRALVDGQDFASSAGNEPLKLFHWLSHFSVPVLVGIIRERDSL